MKVNDKRLKKLEAVAETRTAHVGLPEVIEIEFVHIDGSITDRVLIRGRSQSENRMDLRNPSI